MIAAELLAYDAKQVVGFLKNHRNGNDDGFLISDLDGIEKLTAAQKDELARKLNDASERPEIDEPDAEELAKRLVDLLGQPEPTRRPLPSDSQETLPPREDAALVEEIVSREELLKDGGRPACTIADLSDGVANRNAVLPWLTDDPDTNTAVDEKSSVFSNQLSRWFSFRKSQLINRAGDAQAGFQPFLEAHRRFYKNMASEETVDETIQREWQNIPTTRHLPDGQPLSAFRAQIERRLEPHQFTRRPQLRKDPRQQDNWTDWLEYLNFETWHLEQLSAKAIALEPRFRKSWRLLADMQHSAPKLGARHKGSNVTQLGRAASDKANNEFVRATMPYERALTAVHFHRLRVDWVVKEAHLMEKEISEKRKAMKQNPERTRKRRRDENESEPPEPFGNVAKRLAVDSATCGAAGNHHHDLGPRRSARRQARR